MSKQKLQDTGIELKVEAALKELGVAYVKQHDTGVVKVDFFLPDSKLAVEADGCYFHSCPVHFPLSTRRKNGKDHVRTQMLRNLGYRVLRLWEHEINSLSLPLLTRRIASVI